MKLTDKRSERIVLTVHDLCNGGVYEDSDGDVMMFTSDKNMVVLSSPNIGTPQGFVFEPDETDRFVRLDVEMTINS